MGPMRRIKEKFETRWFQFACPSICVKRVTQFLKLDSEKSPLPGTMNHCKVRERVSVWERTRTAALKKAKVKTAGALYFIFINR
jgi:hypothetical protein